MTAEEYSQKAWKRLGKENIEPSDIEVIDRVLVECYNDGFTLKDAVQYCRLTEHISPDLPERYACDRMNEISFKYRPHRFRRFR